MWERILVIVKKEICQVVRHPRMRTTLFLPPLIQLVIFGYAVNMDVDHVTFAWVDQDHTPASRELLADFTGSGRFILTALPQNENDIRHLLDAGRVQTVIRVLPGFNQDILRSRQTSVQILVDGSNSNSASLISGYAEQVVASYSYKVEREQ